MRKINFIAEVSSNHNRSLSRTLKIINSIKKSGFSSVKFQLFKIDKLFSREILSNSFEHRKRAKWELPLKFIPIISRHCKLKKIKFGCTPFYLEAVDYLNKYVDFFKNLFLRIIMGQVTYKNVQKQKNQLLYRLEWQH